MVDGRCPQCAEGARQGGPSPDKMPIQFDVSVSTPSEAVQQTLDWRAELRSKMSQRVTHRRRPLEKHNQADLAGTTPEETNEASRDSPVKKLFHYEMVPGDSQSPAEGTPRKVAKAEKVVGRVLEKPLVRSAAKSSASTQGMQVPHQQKFRMDPLPPLPSATDSEPETAEAPVLSREILFSRLLGGLVDGSLAVFMGFLFSYSASRVLDLDFFLWDALEFAAMLSVFFFLFNAFFLWASSGQTLGMYLTDLKLVTEDGRDAVNLWSVLLRTVLMLPSIVSVFGLLWSFFDPLCRTLHDLLSGTRIVPAESDPQ